MILKMIPLFWLKFYYACLNERARGATESLYSLMTCRKHAPAMMTILKPFPPSSEMCRRSYVDPSQRSLLVKERNKIFIHMIMMQKDDVLDWKICLMSIGMACRGWSVMLTASIWAAQQGSTCLYARNVMRHWWLSSFSIISIDALLPKWTPIARWKACDGRSIAFKRLS